MKHVITIFLCMILIHAMNAQDINSGNLEGVWQSEGYGRIVHFKKKKVYIYDVCAINCTESQVIPTKILSKLFDIKKTSDTTFVVNSTISKLYFTKMEALPSLCSTSNEKKKDPFYNFDVLWQSFDENYCYFKERKIDWDALRVKYRSQISADIKSFDLFLLLDDMITELKDGHSTMFVPSKLEKKYSKDQAAKREVRAKLIRDSLGEDYKLPSINTESTQLKVIKNYVAEVKSYNYGVLKYGFINDKIAMVQINGMDQFANYDIPTTISEEKAERLYEKFSEASENYTQDNADGAAYIMDQVVSEIKNTEVCIIDLRFNGGGYDEVQLEILKRFAVKDTLVFTKKAQTKNGFTEKAHVFVSPTSNAYKGDVYILTSHSTASAAEDFTLGTMAAIPNAVRIGSSTAGIFSDMLERKLPNGWGYSLSNEIYESPDGISYEVKGIPPHHLITYHKKGYWLYKEFFENKTGKDAAIEKVFELSGLKK